MSEVKKGKYGYARTTTQLIAETAGISRGAMLHHYATKQELIASVIDYAFYKRMEGFTGRIEALTEKQRVKEHAGIELYWQSLLTREFAATLQLSVAARTDEELRALADQHFDAIVALAKKKGVDFKYYPDTRLHSILWKDGKAAYTYAKRSDPNIAAGARTADAAWLAMPRAAIDLVAKATRFERQEHGTVDVLNHEKVNLYLEATIMQPSYKVGMFFDTPWWAPDAASPASDAGEVASR